MLTKNGTNSPKGYTTNDNKPWAWKSHYLATHENMKTNYGIMGSPGETRNTLYISNTVLIKLKVKDFTKHPEEVGVYLDPGI